jgi:RNA polymerase sigma-70 factor (ECF subfamily)
MFAYGMTLAGTVDAEMQRLADGLRKRDLALLQGLVEQYQYRLVRYLIYFLGRPDLVDDLVQETWLRVLERGSQYDGRSRFEAWLFWIARNLALDQMRRRQLLSLDSNDDAESGVGPASPVAAGPSPFEQAARTEDASRIAAALATLAPIYREALVLRFQEDLSLPEIAAITGAPVTTISSRIHRGLAALREQLEGGRHAD